MSSLTFEEIAIAFRNCNGDARFSFKEYLKKSYKSKNDYERGFIISDANNYLLADIEKLLSKGLLNICSADFLIKSGYFSWGFVTSYYANYFLIQALNRTQISFSTWVDHRSIDCACQNYQDKTILVKAIDRSTDEHQRQFQRFFENFKHFRDREGIDRYWNIGIYSFELGNESERRNKINYEISNEAFYELDLEIQEFNKIIKDNKYSPFIKANEYAKTINYARKNLKLAIARMRMLSYILNIIAIRNLEYQSFYKRNMNNRLISIQKKYPGLSSWINDHFNSWLIFNLDLIEKDEI
jgi:hypothetical protein